MKLKHARQILSGKLNGHTYIKHGVILGFETKKGYDYISLTGDDFEYMLRQLALKTVREKEKGK